jgi:hypothetical protein
MKTLCLTSTGKRINPFKQTYAIWGFEVFAETEKAVGVKMANEDDDTLKFWIPKCQITSDSIDTQI